MSREDRKVVAVFSPAYCLARDSKRLTHMNEACLREAILQFKVLSGSYLILSCAYDHWAQEAQIKQQVAREAGIDQNRLLILETVTDRFDEVRRLKKAVAEAGVSRLVMVVEYRHLPSLRQMLKGTMPGVSVQLLPVFCHHFEPTREPWLKSLRASNATLWRLWNWAADILTPLYLRYRPL